MVRLASGGNDRKSRCQQSTASALLNTWRQATPLKCLFCQRNHRASDCTYVANFGERKSLLRKQGRCFVVEITLHEIVILKYNVQNARVIIRQCASKSNVNVKNKDKDDATEKDSGQNREGTSAAVHVNSGAQRFYLSSQVADKLKFETVRTENLVIATFGAEKQQARPTNLVGLSARKLETNFRWNINAYSVPRFVVI